MPRASSVVLDASAMLALLNQEPGAATVLGVLDRAVISAVNLAEVYTRLIDGGMDAPAAVAYGTIASRHNYVRILGA
jgi:PIN domain nuclease of toxin-antitoxin system